jgi:hypothetical protein
MIFKKHQMTKLQVEFDIVKGIKGLLEAACVSGPDGNRVGSIIGEGGGFHRGTFRRRIAGEPGNSERSGGDNQPKAIANGQQNTKAKVLLFQLQSL